MTEEILTHSCLSAVGALDHSALGPWGHVNDVLTDPALHKEALSRSRHLVEEMERWIGRCLECVCSLLPWEEHREEAGQH